jgi:AcrR family transcriptional regulator
MRTRDVHKENCIRYKAIEMIVKEGLDGFSMQKLAKAAGVSPATLYIYYKDREDLILKIATDVTVNMMDISLKGLSVDMSFAEGMAIQWKNRVEFFLKHPLDVEFIEQIRYTPLYDQIKETIRAKFSDVLGGFAHKAIERGELMRLPFEVYWSVAFAPLYQLLKFHMQGSSPKTEHFQISDEVINQTLQLVLKALKP